MTEWSFALHPSPRSPTVYYKAVKTLTAYYPRLSMWHFWSWCFCPLPWRERSYLKSDVTDSVTATVTSHPIDKTDGRRDSWRHGTKLVWAAAVLPLVCCHDRGGFYYLDECLPSLPGLTGAMLVREEEEGVGGVLEMKGWIDQGPDFASSQPLSIVAWRLGLFISLWTLHSKEPRNKKCINHK